MIAEVDKVDQTREKSHVYKTICLDERCTTMN